MSVVPEPLAPSCAEGNGGEYNRLLLHRKHTKVFVDSYSELQNLKVVIDLSMKI